MSRWERRTTIPNACLVENNLKLKNDTDNFVGGVCITKTFSTHADQDWWCFLAAHPREKATSHAFHLILAKSKIRVDAYLPSKDVCATNLIPLLHPSLLFSKVKRSRGIASRTCKKVRYLLEIILAIIRRIGWYMIAIMSIHHFIELLPQRQHKSHTGVILC